MNSLDDIDDIYQPDNPMDIICKLEIDITVQLENYDGPYSQSVGCPAVSNPAFDCDVAERVSSEDFSPVTSRYGGGDSEPAPSV